MISVVVVNWNAGPVLERCVRSVLEHAPGCEVVVVDNASEDGSMEFAGRLAGSLVVMYNSGNAGFAAACNQGWRAAGGDEILFLNPDTEATPGGIAALSARLAAEPAVWAAAGRLLCSGAGRAVSPSVRTFPSLASVGAEMLMLDELWPRNPWTRRYRMADWRLDTPREVEQPSAACLMVRRAALASLGGFDEIFWPAWFEDVDLCKRIRAAGGRIVFEPVASFLHQGASSLRALAPEEFLRAYHTNLIRYFEKHHGRARAAAVRRLVRAGLYLRAVVTALGAAPAAPGRSSSPRAYWRAARRLAGVTGRRP